MSVLAQAAITKYYKLSGLSTTELYFSQFWSMEIQGQGASMAGFADGWPLLVSLHGRKRVGQLSALSSKALIPFTRGPPSWPNYLPKASLSKKHYIVD